MKKRILSLAMASVMVLSLAACGGKSEAPSDTTTAAQTETTAASGSGETTAAAEGGETQAPAASSSSNPNAGKGMYPGTSKKGIGIG